MTAGRDAFAAELEPHRRELRVHCYRMTGSFQDAEDLVQETFLRAWRSRDTFAGRSSLRAWLYRIATNVCLDALARLPRRVLPDALGPAGGPDEVAAEVPWLQPFPDALMDPADALTSRETVELAFLAAIQHLPPRQRAVLLLRDVLGWPARDAADLLEVSVAAANSALQRAREGLRARLPERRGDWAARTAPSEEERALLARFMDAMERVDLDTVASLVAEDARATMPPLLLWFQGRAAIMRGLVESNDPALPGYVGAFRMVATAANRQPAAAGYTRTPGDDVHRAFALTVVRVEGARIVEFTAFPPEVFPSFGLPMTLEAPAGLNGGADRARAAR